MRHTLLFVVSIALSIIIVNPIYGQKRLEQKDKYYYIYGNQKIEKSDISDFLRTHCTDAYEQYHNKFLKIGWGICVPSMTMLVGGAILSFAGSSTSMAYVGIGLGAAGAAGLLASVPLLCIGYDKRKQTCSVFNSECAGYASTKPLMLNFNVGPQSLGLALVF